MTGPGEFCCDEMRQHSHHDCYLVDYWKCPDVLVLRHRDGAYALPVRDGGASSIDIRHCPWCGTRLPDADDAVEPRTGTPT